MFVYINVCVPTILSLVACRLFGTVSTLTCHTVPLVLLALALLLSWFDCHCRHLITKLAKGRAEGVTSGFTSSMPPLASSFPIFFFFFLFFFFNFWILFIFNFFKIWFCPVLYVLVYLISVLISLPFTVDLGMFLWWTLDHFFVCLFVFYYYDFFKFNFRAL